MRPQDDTLELSAQVGLQALLSATSTRRLDKSCARDAWVSTSWSPQGGVGMQVRGAGRGGGAGPVIRLECSALAAAGKAQASGSEGCTQLNSQLSIYTATISKISNGLYSCLAQVGCSQALFHNMTGSVNCVLGPTGATGVATTITKRWGMVGGRLDRKAHCVC